MCFYCFTERCFGKKPWKPRGTYEERQWWQEQDHWSTQQGIGWYQTGTNTF